MFAKACAGTPSKDAIRIAEAQLKDIYKRPEYCTLYGMAIRSEALIGVARRRSRPVWFSSWVDRESAFSWMMHTVDDAERRVEHPH
jgi:hypothetical protein